MTIRQLWVRMRALPHDSPLGVELQKAAEAAEDARQSADVDDALTRYL